MFLIDVVFAFVIALLLSTLFFSRRRQSDGWAGLLLFFSVIFFASWAGGLWVVPFGPLLLGVAWIPFLTIGLITALILSAFSPPYRRSVEVHETATDEAERAQTVMWGFFWLVVTVLIVTIIFGYAFN